MCVCVCVYIVCVCVCVYVCVMVVSKLSVYCGVGAVECLILSGITLKLSQIIV